MKRVSSKKDVEIFYKTIWHRWPRKDEVDAHMRWRTPFDRLINWLVDNTPDELIGWHRPMPKEVPWRMTAGFLDPEYKRKMGFDHYGWDLAYPYDINVLCAGQGLVMETGFDSGVRWPRRSRTPYGNYVIVRHNKHWRTLYAHMHKIEVAPGWFVPSDHKLGTGDSTGWSTGNHLHLELQKKVWWGWQKVNPGIKIK
jgi:murein DD-endopeptidase MepM/ murein hydrolase activator NlpD